jgi:hypothetical protein
VIGSGLEHPCAAEFHFPEPESGNLVPTRTALDAKEHASEIIQFFVVDIFQQGSENARSFAQIPTLNSILHTVQFETFAEWLDLFSSL